MTQYNFTDVEKSLIDQENYHISMRCTESVDTGDTTQMSVMLDGKHVMLKISSKVKKDKEIYPPFVPIHLFAKKRANHYLVTHIYSDVLFHAVNNTEGTPQLTFMKLDMLVSDKEPISDQLELFSSSKDKSNETKSNPGVSGKPDLMKKYDLLKSTFTQYEDAVVNKWLYHPTLAAKDDRKLEMFLNVAPNYMYRPLSVSEDKLKKAFDGEIYGLDNAKQVMIQKLARKSRTKGVRGNRILIVGPSGCGKSALANAYACASCLPRATVELSSVSSALDLKGCLSTYEGADFSIFLKAFKIYNTSEMVFILENLEKLPSGDGDKDGKPMDVIAAIAANQRTFTDAYMELPISTCNTDFIITACSTENIPHSILDNCTVIRLDEYSFEERVDIAREMLLPTLYLEGEYEFDYPVISDKLLMYIARNYCCDDGVKDLNSHLKTLLEQLPSIGKINKKTIDKVLSPMVDEKNPGLRLNRNYDRFTPELVKEIRKTIQKTQSNLVYDKEKGIEKMRLDYLLKAAKTPCAKINMKQFKKEINQSHFGMEKVKEKIIDAFTSQEIFGTLRSILLVGPAGTGKTTISRTIAHASAKAFKKISLNGLDHSSVLRGLTKTHKSADAGEIIKAVCDASSNTVLLMDEVDKMNPAMANTILDLIDEYQFTDDFIGVPFDLSNVLFIFTANDASRISPYLYDRFDTVIYLDGYDRSQRTQIVRDYVIPEINREYKLSVTIDDTAIETLVNEYSVTNGVRDIKNKIYEIVRHLCAQDKNKKIHITEKDITSYFDKPIARGNIPQSGNDSGVALGLAVSSRGGMTFAVETELIPKANYLKITGLPETDVRESAELCLTYIRKHFHRLLNDGVHIHYSEGAVKKSGPSAGVTTFISLLSAAFDVPVSHRYAYTGELDLKGYVFSIGAVIEKIEAAARHGCETVFIPAENYKHMVDKGTDLQSFGVEIVPVSHISEVIARVLPEAFSNNRKKSA